jgi:hypothetical protein
MGCLGVSGCAGRSLVSGWPAVPAVLVGQLSSAAPKRAATRLAWIDETACWRERPLRPVVLLGIRSEYEVLQGFWAGACRGDGA